MRDRNVKNSVLAIAAVVPLLMTGCQSDAVSNAETEALKEQIARLERQVADLERQQPAAGSVQQTQAPGTTGRHRMIQALGTTGRHRMTQVSEAARSPKAMPETIHRFSLTGIPEISILPGMTRGTIMISPITPETAVRQISRGLPRMG